MKIYWLSPTGPHSSGLTCCSVPPACYRLGGGASMPPQVYTDAKDAVADIPDGSVIALGGFSAALGAPISVMSAFIDTTTCKDLTFVGNGTPQVAIVRGGPMKTLDAARVRKC